MSTSKKESEKLTGQITTKSGKGNGHGVISEASVYFTLKPGHADEARAAAIRFGERIRNAPPEETQRTGLRDARIVVFDDGRRIQFASGFETDWDPYVDDAILLVGIEHFLDWLQYTEEAQELVAAAKKLDRNSPDFEEKFKPATALLKATIQANQAPAATYFNALNDLTVPQIRKAQRVQQAFQQVLDGYSDLVHAIT